MEDYKDYLLESIKRLTELRDMTKNSDVRLYFDGQIFGLEQAVSLFEFCLKK